MKLYYYKDPKGNFGDDLNPWIWNALAPGLIDSDDSTLLLGIGTLINSRVPRKPQKLVFGSGVGYCDSATTDDTWKFYCVRGPLSAASLGISESLAITDPAILLTQIVAEPAVPSGLVGYMPHHLSASFADWEDICKKAGLIYLDPQADAKETVAKLRSAKLVITEAMHGAIVADAFRIPWIPVKCYDHILEFKWNDWCKSLEVEYQPQTIARLWDTDKHLALNDLVKTKIKRGLRSAGVWSRDWTPPHPSDNLRKASGDVVESLIRLSKSPLQFLSRDRIHAQSIDRLLSKLDQLKRDFPALE
jgi:succinoglycan biosynthesis protein ExoV